MGTLWEKEIQARREAMGLGPFEAQFMQNPSVAAGGRLFRLEEFGQWHQLPRSPQREWDPLDLIYQSPLDAARADDSMFVKIAGCDFAGTDNTSSGGSYSAIVTLLTNLLTGECYILDCERYRNLEFLELRNKVVVHLAKHGPNIVVIESNDATGGRMIGDLSRTSRWPIRAVKPKSSKEARAIQIVGMVESGKVFLPARATPNIDDLRRELAEFPGGRYTDQADALIWALLASRQYVAASQENALFERQWDRFSLFG